MGRGKAAEGYTGSVDRPVLAGDQPLEPIIGHLAMLIGQLADAEHVLFMRARIEADARCIEEFFRVRWDAPEELAK